jgi:hypothetical protein
MSKERKQRDSLSQMWEEPQKDKVEGFDIADAAETIRATNEASYWSRLSMMYLRFRAAGMHRQADLVQIDLQNELKRTDVKNQWSAENGGSAPPAKPIDWGEV